MTAQLSSGIRSRAFKINLPSTLKRQKFTISRYAFDLQRNYDRALNPVPDFATEIGSNHEW